MEDVGKSAEDKSVEDHLTVSINEDSSCFFLVGTALSDPEQEQLISFLKRNIEIFTWTPYEMLGVDTSFIYHKLNVNPN